MNIVYFIALVGVLIFVHELGHFVWAKAFGVKVLKFSLGFGPTLAGFTAGETEYVIAMVPLGGYVRMLGEAADDPVVNEEDVARSFHHQALWKRVIIVSGGPAMNLVFPLLLFFVVFLSDSAMTPATLGTVVPGGPADAAGLLAGDRVVRADGRDISTFYELARVIGAHAERPLALAVERGEEEIEVQVTPYRARETRELDLVEEVGRIGILPYHPLAVVGVSGGPAHASGLRTFDRIISAGRRPVERFHDLRRMFTGNQGYMVPVTYLRPQHVPDALGGLAELDIYEPHVAQITPEPGVEDPIAAAGLELADLYVSHVVRDSPEYRAGIRPRDRIVALDGTEVRSWVELDARLRAASREPHTFRWRRGGEEREAELRLARDVGESDYGQRYDRARFGLRHWVPTELDHAVPNPRPIRYAIALSVRQSWEMVELTVFSVVRMLQGRLSVRTLGGPLSIMEVTQEAAQEGALNFLAVMAFISINLGLINLLPIPMLDGGHLLFFLVEGVTRRPLSVRVRQYASLAGLAVLLLLVAISFKNDLERYWPRFAEATALDEAGEVEEAAAP